jgi:hypothetical protein
MATKVQRYHLHHAEASVLQANLNLPFPQNLAPHTHSKLNPQGGYVSQFSENFRLGGVFSFRSARTHVAGNVDDKPDHGWNTLSTCVVEGLNVMEVVTADRIVAQVSTDHPPVGYVPRVSLLGTRFENLRIAGYPIEIDLDLNILGPKPAKDAPYTSDAGFISRVANQYKRIQGSQNLPADILKRYNQLPTSSANRESIECSLVNQVKGSYPGRSFGHVIEIPDFGKIYLGVLRVEQSDFEKGVPKKTTISLDMIKLEMGCVASGQGSAGSTINNGGTKP